MNNETNFKFPSLDTALNAFVVGGMAVTCALLVTVSTVQAVVA
jgi:hypothetical protein